MKLRPGFAIFLGNKFSTATREYKLALQQYESAIRCICVDTGDETYLQRVFCDAIGLLNARSIRELIKQGIVSDDNLGQVSAMFFIDFDQIGFLAVTLKAFVAALGTISFDTRRLHFVTIVAGPADREEAKLSSSRVHQVFGSAFGDGIGFQTAVLTLLPWFDGAPIQNRADLYRLVGFVGQLCSLSEGNPRRSEFSKFKNAHLIGKTYVAGLRSYVTGNVNAAVRAFVLAAAWKRIGALFKGQDIPSRKVLGDLIQETFPASTCTVEQDDDPLGQLALERARKEYMPLFVSRLSCQVRTYSEFVQLIRLIANETTVLRNQSAPVAALLLVIPNWYLGIGICVAVAIAVAMVARWRRSLEALTTRPSAVETPGGLPKGHFLHRVFDEFLSSLPTEVNNVPRVSHRISGMDLLPFQESYDPSESQGAQLAAEDHIVAVADDVVSGLFVVTRQGEWIAASRVEGLRTGLERCQSSVEAAIYADFVSWVQENQSVADTEQHRWLFSQRMPITDIRCFEFRPEALSSPDSEASLLRSSINFLYLVPTPWN